MDLFKKGIEKSLGKKTLSGIIKSYFGGEIPDYTIDYFFGVYNNARHILFNELKKGKVAVKKTIDYIIRKTDNENYLVFNFL